MTLLESFRHIVIIISLCYAALHITTTYNKHIIPPTYTLYVDDSFSILEREAIYDAADAWQRATHNRVKFDLRIHSVPEFKHDIYTKVKSVNEYIIWKLESESENLLVFELFNVGRPIVGYAPPKVNMILVPDRAESFETLRLIAIHELGHHIGLEHTPSLMSMSSVPAPQHKCITKYDLEQFCDLYDCDRKYHTSEICL